MPGLTVPSDFDLLQLAVRASAERRQAEARACEALLTALYHALRHASGPGLPLNNVSLEQVEDVDARLRPAVQGGWHAAWFRLGLCEVYVRVRQDAGQFVGEYGTHGQFTLDGPDEAALTALSRELLRTLAGEYDPAVPARGTVN